MKLRFHLFRLVLFAIVPVLIFAVAMAFMLHREKVAGQEELLVQAADTLSLAIDRELMASIRTLHVLATSEHLDSGNFKRVYEQSQRALSGHGTWDAIVLVDPNGQQLMNTRVSFGAQLPHTGIPEMLEEILRTGRPWVSNLFTGPVRKAPVIAIGVPVVRAGKVKYILSSSTSPNFLANILADQKSGIDFRNVVIDRNKIILARTPAIEEFLGKPAAANISARSRDAEAGYFQGVTLEGIPVATGFHRSQLSGWTVGVGLPLATLNAPLRLSLIYLGAGGAALVILGLMLAQIEARRVARSIAALVESAQAIGRGETPPFIAPSITEIDKVAQAHQEAAANRRRAEAALRESEARFHAIFDQAAVGVAEIDSTTGRLLRSNDKYSQIMGYTEEELRQLDFMRLTHSEDLTPDLTAMERLRTGAAREFTLEKRLLRKDRSAVWVNLTVSAMWPIGAPPTTHIAVIQDITERKEVQEKLASAENRFRALIENSGDGIALFDRAGKFLYLSPSSTRMTGWLADDLLGLCFDAFVHADDRALATEAFATVTQAPATRPAVEFRYRNKNGDWRWMQAVLTNLLDEPNVQAVVCNFRDITERKIADDKLKGAEQRFRALVENSADAIALLDQDGKVIYLTSSAMRLTGRPPEERIGLSHNVFHHPDDSGAGASAFAEVRRNPAARATYRYRTRHNDGSWRWMEAVLTNLLDDPDVHAIVCNYRDITAPKEAQDKLADAEKRFRAMIENSGDGIALLGREGTVVYVSPSATRITGRSMEEWLGATFKDYVHPDDMALITDAFATVTQFPATSLAVEFRCLHANGEWHWIQAVLTNLLDEPHVQAVISNFRDITERIEADQEIHRVLDEIQQLHDIARTMLSTTDLRSMAETILAKALYLSGCDLGVIRLLDQSTGKIAIVASVGYRDPESLLRHANFSIKQNGYSAREPGPRQRLRAFSLRQTDIVEQIQDQSRMQTFKQEGIVSVITIPVAVADNSNGVMQLGTRMARKFDPRLVRLLETLAQDFAIALQKSKLMDDTLAAQQQSRELSRRLVEVQETERRYIASELHDEIGSLLTGLKIVVGTGGGTNVERAQALIDDALAKARSLAQHLRPPMLDHFGLLPTLHWYANEFMARTKITVDLQHDDSTRRFSAAIETAVFRIFQEALTNVARHAEASIVSATLRMSESALYLAIQDNGVGFDANTGFTKYSSSGLSGMRERAASLAGSIDIRSKPGEGTCVGIEIPLGQDGGVLPS